MAPLTNNIDIDIDIELPKKMLRSIFQCRHVIVETTEDK